MEKETLLNIIASALELDASEITFEISQKNCEKWDSLAHLSISQHKPRDRKFFH